LVSEQLIEKIPRVGNRVVQPERETNTVVQFAYYNSLVTEAAMEQLIADFQQLYPHIRIKPVPIGANDYFRTKTTLMDQGTVDVLTVNHTGFRVFREMGGTDYWDSLEPNPGHYPFLTEAFRYNGQLKVKPMIFSPLILCYNKKHFHDSGIREPDGSWRWKQLFEAEGRLTKKGERLGFYCHLLSQNRWPVLFLQSGATFHKEANGKFKLCGTPFMDGLRAGRELVMMQNRNPLLLSENDHHAEQLFFSGKVSSIMTTYIHLNQYLASYPELAFDLAPLPYLHKQTTLLQSVGLAIYSRSAVKASALCFVDYMTSYRAQLIIRQQTISIPALKQAAEWTGEEKGYRPSRFYMYLDIIPTFRLFDDLNLTHDQLGRLAKEAKLYWSGIETEEGVCQRLEEVL
ncbi:MAG: GntR family transcriptional regulator, partial [Paenibacillus sp.]|nr:GntR family transcriptional regulator [Paenibacillus sp.]